MKMNTNILSRNLLFTSAFASVITIIGIYFIKKFYNEKVPKKWMKIGTVKQLYLYPLKSGNRIQLSEVECTKTCIKQTKNTSNLFQLKDRCLSVYGDKDGEFRTARTYPKMLKINVKIHDQDHLSLDAPDMTTLIVKIPKKKEKPSVDIKFWYKELIKGIDCGDEAATWMSHYIIGKDSGLRLAYNDDTQRRDITKTHQELLNYYKNLNNNATGLFTDLSCVLLINQSSINDMNTKISDSTVTAENFRPNIIIDGPHVEPYSEDNWEWIKIGDEVILRNVKECTRCVMTTINPDTAIRDPKREPLRTLEKYRKSNGPESTPVMGINLGVKQEGLIKIDYPVYISIND